MLRTKEIQTQQTSSDMIPKTNEVYNLGTSLIYWLNSYLKNIFSKKVTLVGSSSGQVSLEAKETGSTISLKIPTDPLVDNSFLKTDASGNLSWDFLYIPGRITIFARNTAPSGWLVADGTAVSRSTYANLFSAIGTTFGAGDGSTTFNLPDLRGEFIRGWDFGRGVDPGRAFGSGQMDEIKTHTHTVQHGVNFNVLGTLTGSNISTYYGYTGNTGGSETRPLNIALLLCIKY